MRCLRNRWGVAALTVALTTCGALPAMAQSPPGNLGPDWSRYVAIGDSLTMAYWSGGVSVRQQAYSYPALLHRQGAGTDAGFEQPLISEPGYPGQLELLTLDPVLLVPVGVDGVETNRSLPRPFDNLGISGAAVGDLEHTLCDDGYWDIVLRNPCDGVGIDRSVIDQALALEPTLISVWIGSNDALSAALFGLIIDEVTLSDLDRFTADYESAIDRLAASGADLIIANIPAVTAVPYVNTLKWYRTDSDSGEPLLDASNRRIPLWGRTGGGVRELADGDFVLLTASSSIAAGVGQSEQNPIRNDELLDAGEVAIIQDRVDRFNDLIRAKAMEHDAVFVDVDSYFRDVLVNGFPVGGIPYSADFLSGGLFSYDGVHPSSMGYAVIANRFLAAINARYGSNIPSVNLGPFVFGTADDGNDGGGNGDGSGAAGVPPDQARRAQFDRSAIDNLQRGLTGMTREELLARIGARPFRPRPASDRYRFEKSDR